MTHIRFLTDSDSDLAAVMRLFGQMAKGEGDRLTYSNPANLRVSMFTPNSPTHCLVVENEQGTIIAFAVFLDFFSMFAGNTGIYLLGLFVEESYRNRGIGKSLLREVAQYAQKKGHDFIRWLVHENSDRALQMYQKLGATTEPGWIICRVAGKEIENLVKG